MTPSNHILLFGHDAALLQTRGWILNQDGIAVDSVAALREVVSCLTGKAYRLLVLCHSLSAMEQKATIALACSIQPELQVLVLDKAYPASTGLPAAQSLPKDAGPENFRLTVQLLVNSTGQRNCLAERKAGTAELDGTVKWFNNAKGYGFLGRDDRGADDFAGSQLYSV